jgi:hydrogenase-4 component B
VFIFLLSIPILLAGAALSALLRSNRASAIVSILSQAAAVILVTAKIAPVLGGAAVLDGILPWPSPIQSISFHVDGLGAFFLSWSLPMTWLGTVYATGYLKPYFDKGRRGGPHFALLNMTQLAFVLIYSVQNALVFLLAWEIAAVAAWLLVIWDYSQQKIRFAGFNYLVSTHVGMFVLVAAFMLMHSQTGSLDFKDFGAFLSRSSPARDAVFLLLGIAFALKSAFFPFHTWLPRAHSAAPAHVSALMSGVIHKAGLFGFLRFTLLQGRPEEWMGWSVLAFGALSAFVGAINTVPQRDLKRMLGYSSTENVGIAAMGFGIGYLGWTWNAPGLALCGFAGGILHLVNHAFFKCLLFYAAGSIYRTVHSIDLERLGGLGKTLPRTAVLFLVGGVAIAGLPPLNGFLSEFILYSGLLSGAAATRQGNLLFVLAAALLAFVGGVSAFSITRSFGLAFLGQPRDPHLHPGGDPPRSMLASMAAQAAGVLALGLVPALGGFLIRSALRLFPILAGASVALPLPAQLEWISTLLAILIAVSLLFAWLKSKGARLSETWACGYTAVSARMQYTGTSFARQFAALWPGFLPALRREQLPDALFPHRPSHLATHHVDAVERGIFAALGQGEELMTRASDSISEQSHIGFAAGLAVLILMVALLFGGFSL